MAQKPNLRAVTDVDKPVRKILSILEAAEFGSRLDELVAMRRRIAKALDSDDTSPRDLSSLSRRQIEISKEIDALKKQLDEEATHDADTSDEEWSEEAI